MKKLQCLCAVLFMITLTACSNISGNDQKNPRFQGKEDNHSLSVAAGGAFISYAAITEDGSLYTWGGNGSGELGNGKKGYEQKTPLKVMDNVKSVTMGSYTCAIITESNELFISGQGSSSIEPDGKPKKRTDNVVCADVGKNHYAYIQNDGSLWLWGYNKDGQIGNGSNEKAPEPIKIMEDVIAVSLGEEHSGCVTSDGTLWMWGNNEYEQLGTGDTENKNEPVKIMDNIRSLELNSRISYAIDNNNNLYIWGTTHEKQTSFDSSKRIDKPLKIFESVQSITGSDVITLDNQLYTLHLDEKYSPNFSFKFDNIYESEFAGDYVVTMNGKLYDCSSQDELMEKNIILNNIKVERK